MTAYGATIVVDSASPLVGRIRLALENEEYKPVIGEAGTVALIDHFNDKEADPDAHKTAARLGARPVGLYSQFARGTSYAQSTEGVMLAINHPAIMQRIKGGTIKPVNKQFLTIPANAASYGKSAAKFAGELELRWYRAANGELRGMLVAGKKVTRKKRGGKKDEQSAEARPQVYYWLVRSVKQAADDTVTPDRESLLTSIDDAVGPWLEGLSNG